MLGKLAVLTRYLLGFDFLINGVNWWWKVLPYPALHDPPDPHSPRFVQAMIETGFLFDAIKGLEIVAGIALLANRFVPLTLVVAFPVTVGAWAVDVGMLSRSVRAQTMGWSLLAMNAFLMLAYLESYGGLLRANASPWSSEGNRGESRLSGMTRLAAGFGFVTVAAGAVAVAWLLLMAGERLR